MGTSNLELTASEMGRAIEQNSLDPVDLLDEYYDVIRTDGLSSSIYSVLTQERAYQEARMASARANANARLSPLDGVPISWKDLFDTDGIKTEAGSKLLQDRVPDADAEVVKRCSNAGLICLGKTHMSELAFSGLGLNPVMATPPCVNNAKAVAGGSSSGAAASVAFGMAALAIGSDTGGSVRVPACWNDLVGLKTTHGLIPLDGVVPLCRSFDTVGPLCRTVADTALIYSILVGVPEINPSGVDLKDLSFLVPDADILGYIRPQPAEGFNRVVERLRTTGTKIVHKHVPVIDKAFELTGCLYGAEAYSEWGNVIEARPEIMFARIRERFLAGQKFSATELAFAWDELKSLRLELYGEMHGHDALLLPTCPILPPDVERLMSEPDFYTDENLLALRNTRVGNLFNLPTLTIPTPIPSAGISVMAGPFDEPKILKIGQALESLVQRL